MKPFANYAPSIAAAGPGDTVKLAGAESVPADKTINALLLTAAATTTTAVTLDPGVTLTLAAGALVSAGSGSASVGPSAPGVVSRLAFGREGVITRNNAFAGGDLTVAAEITGEAGLTLSGPAGLVLSPPAPSGNRYTGGTTINSGQVTVGADNSPFGGTAGGALDFYGGSLGIDVFVGPVTIPNSVRLDDATATFHGIPDITFSGDVTIPRTSTLAPPGGFDLTLTGKVSGGGGLVVRAGSPGGGRLTLANPANDYAGSTLLVNNNIFRPTLRLGAAGALGGGPLHLHQGTLEAAAPITISQVARLDNSDVAFGGEHPITFGVIVDVYGINTLNTAVPTTMASGRFGTGALTKTGAGTLVLGGGNNHTGATAVTNGALLINGSASQSPVAVTGNGTLGGNGTAGPIATADQGKVNPGNPATARGTLTAPSANFSNGGGLTIEVSGYGAAGVAYDRLDLGLTAPGQLLVGGNSTLNVDLAGVTSTGTASGVVRYGTRLGTVPQFSRVNVLNSAFAVQTEYTPTQLNLIVTPDQTPPAVTSSSFEFRRPPHRLLFAFSEDVSASLGPGDLTVRNLTTGETLPSNAFTPSYDPATHTVTYTYTPGHLPDGNYRATLAAAGVRDRAGNALAADHALDFFVLSGDINRDRAVNGSDFAILAGNFGRTGMTYAQGDLNGDGSVNGSDFAILAGNFGKTVPQPAAVAAVAPPTPTAAASQRPATQARRVVQVQATTPRRIPVTKPAPRRVVMRSK